MRHKDGYRKLRRGHSHRMAMFRNLVVSLLTHGRIATTVTRAKEARKFAERMITLGKRGGLANRRHALSFLQDEGVVAKIFGDLAERFKERQGGYTRIVRFGGSRWDGDGRGAYAMRRLGDGAERALFELVDRKEPEQEQFLAGRGARARDERLIERRARKEKMNKAGAKA